MSLVIDNRIFKQRNVDIATVSKEDALAWGFSGPLIRGSGIAWDLRKSQPYNAYAAMDFEIPIGNRGDCYDRFIVRLAEVYQSAPFIHLFLRLIPSRPFASLDPKVVPPLRAEIILVRTTTPSALQSLLLISSAFLFFYYHFSFLS